MEKKDNNFDYVKDILQYCEEDINLEEVPIDILRAMYLDKAREVKVLEEKYNKVLKENRKIGEYIVNELVPIDFVIEELETVRKDSPYAAELYKVELVIELYRKMTKEVFYEGVKECEF